MTKIPFWMLPFYLAFRAIVAVMMWPYYTLRAVLRLEFWAAKRALRRK